MTGCFVKGCKHHSQRDKCKFHMIPKHNLALRKRWLALLKQVDLRDPTPSSRICSCHLLDGNKMIGPVVFEKQGQKYMILKSEDPILKHRKIALKGGTNNDEQTNEANSSVGLQCASTMSSIGLQEEFKSSYQPGVPFSALHDAENYFLKKQIDEMEEKLKNFGERMSFEAIQSDDTKVFMYTGMPTAKMFTKLLNLFEEIEIVKFHNGWKIQKISRADQLLMTLMKLKMNLPNLDLCVRFNVCQSTVSNIVLTWINILHDILITDLMTKVPAKISNCPPSCFCEFQSCVVLDTMEVYSVVSKYKSEFISIRKRTIWKGLVGVAPNGFITFSSGLYESAACSDEIVQDSDVLNKFESGILVLDDEETPVKCYLPEGMKNVPEASLPRVRFVMAAAIEKIRDFEVLKKIPSMLTPVLVKAWQVCCALTNLRHQNVDEVYELPIK